VGLGKTLEMMSALRPAGEQLLLQKQALNQYLDVVFGNGLRVDRGEQPDPFWVKEAGFAAGKLAEQLGLHRQAADLYERLIQILPAMRPALEKRLERARLLSATGG
jgi:hypothetical protein